MGPPVTWSTYRESIGDRSPLFRQVAAGWPVRRALYPGSYVDLSPSVAIPSVTYVDTDRRAARYFADPDLPRSELAGRADPGAATEIRFLHADYTEGLPLPKAGFNLLISLYAGPVWDHCRQYLAPGGLLLANASHGDASLAALDPTLELAAVADHAHGRWTVVSDRLERFLVARDPSRNDPAAIRRSGRGIAYTRPAFAYLFRLRDQS